MQFLGFRSVWGESTFFKYQILFHKTTTELNECLFAHKSMEYSALLFTLLRMHISLRSSPLSKWFPPKMTRSSSTVVAVWSRRGAGSTPLTTGVDHFQLSYPIEQTEMPSLSPPYNTKSSPTFESVPPWDPDTECTPSASSSLVAAICGHLANENKLEYVIFCHLHHCLLSKLTISRNSHHFSKIATISIPNKDADQQWHIL